MKKIVWTFGLISGGVLSLFMLATLPFIHKIDFDKGEILGYTGMVLGFLLVYFGIRSYRDNVGAGRISFGRAFSVGILITLISSACYVLTWEVINYKLMPNFAQDYSQHMIANVKASGASEAVIQAKTIEMQKFQEMYKNPLYNIAMTFIEPFPVGLVITLICAAILRRKDEQQGHVIPAVAS